MNNDIAAHNIRIEDIHADEEFNCRGKIRPIDVADLAQDIEAKGLLQPVLVCQYNEEEEKETGKKYRLIAGFRRFKAHQVLEKEYIGCVIKDHLTEVDARLINLTENIRREDLNIIQEAKAVAVLRQLGANEEHIGNSLGKSRGWVQIRMMLLKLPVPIQEEVRLGMINQTQIRELYSIMNYGSIDNLNEAVRKIKDAKIKGRTISVNPNTNRPNVARHRKRSEIFNMMEHIMDSQIGSGLHTRCMSWCAGQINDIELYQSLKVYAIKAGVDYDLPKEAMALLSETGK